MKIYTNCITILILIISLSSCCTKISKTDSAQDSKDKIAKVSAFQKNQNNLSPGTADIIGEVVSFRNESGGLKSKIRVDQINGYGGSTPPLGVGAEIVCDISATLIKEKNQTESELFKKGNSYNFVIKYQFGAAAGDSISDWKTISFK